MKVFKGLRGFKKDAAGSVVTIGVFDGIHVGHRKVIGKVVSRAKELGLESVVMTFHPHPQKILNPKSRVKSLISLEHRIRLIKEFGVDALILINFTRKLAKLSARDFIKNVLVRKIGSREVYIGENFYFGNGGRTGAKELKRIEKDFGINVGIIKSATKGGSIVSSSLIRHLIAGGRLAEARELLGRRVSVFGTVISGARIARKLGYPTANINPHHEVVPPSGVYAVKAHFGGKEFKGVLNIGTRPTFYGSRDKEPAIEAHLFDFHKPLYGKDIEIFFIKKIRDERKFKNEQELITRIKLDSAIARSIT